jgi:hypothetical protein
MWISAGDGTIEDIQGNKFDLNGPTDLAPVTMMVRRVEGEIEDGILQVDDINLSALKAYEQRQGIRYSLSSWFERLVGRGIPETDDDAEAIDPGKLRRLHNLTFLQELYYKLVDPVMLKTDPGEEHILDAVDLVEPMAIGQIPVGTWLKMWALVDVENGHIDGIVYPETDFNQIKFAFASFTVDMRDEDMLVVNWDKAQPDLVVKELDRDILPEFKRQGLVIYRPDKDSLRLDVSGRLRRPSQWLEDHLEGLGPRSGTQQPTTAVSGLSFDQHDCATTGAFAMGASGAGPEGVG